METTKINCVAYLHSVVLGFVDITVEANPNYDNEIIISRNRIELPRNIRCSQIREIIFYGSLEVARVTLDTAEVFMLELAGRFGNARFELCI